MASSTLTNPANSYRLSAHAERPFAPMSNVKPKSHFLVFATGEAEYRWRIVALATKRTISPRMSIAFTVRKCARLNGQRGAAWLDPLEGALSGLPDANSCSAYHKGIENGFEKKH